MRYRKRLLAAVLLGLLSMPSPAQETSPQPAAPPPAEQPAAESQAPADQAGQELAPWIARRLRGEEGFGLGTAVGDPTILNGPDRKETVLDQTTRASTINVTGHYLWKPADNQQLLLELNLDPTFLGTDISYSWQPQGWEGVWTGNFTLSSARFSPFQVAVPQVTLPNGFNDPFLQQAGFGLEYAQPMTEDLELAVGLNYQNFAFADKLLGGDRFARDITGQPLALGDRATGELYTLDLQGLYRTLDDPDLPTEGSNLRFGVEQGFGLGNISTSYTRLAANAAHLFRAPGFNDGPHSLLLNLQAGTLLGDDGPQIRGFHLGGPFSVRGYEQGEMASGKSFFQASLEYRHHLTRFNLLDNDIDMRAAAFVDYGTVLGTQRDLRGIPEYLYSKPTHGTGYGVGLHFGTDFGLIRVETAWTADGNSSTYLSVGERF